MADRETTIEQRVIQLEYFEEKTERHISEMKKSVQDMSNDVKDIKNAIAGNSINNENGLIHTVVDMKRKQDEESKVLLTHKTYFGQIAWFIGVMSALIVGIIIKIFSK